MRSLPETIIILSTGNVSMLLFKIKKLAVYGMSGLVMLSLSANAGVILTSTRVVYESTARQKTIKAVNHGASPVLIQTWIDDGQEMTSPDKLNLPFMVTPPVGRLDPGREQTIKITSLNNQLPKDRESVYWLSVMEIPAKAKESSGANVLQVALRTRIKLFWRPEGLTGNVAEAAEKLQWQMTSNSAKPGLMVTNPSPYYISLSKAELKTAGRSLNVTTKMVPPFGKEEFPVTGLSALPATAELHYIAIGDQGNILENTKSIH